MSKLDWYTCVLIYVLRSQFQRISIKTEERSPILWRVRGESSKSRIVRNNSEVEFCRKFKSFPIAKNHSEDFFTSGLVRVLVCFPFYRIHWDWMLVMFMRCFFLLCWCLGDGKCVICDSYVRPCTLVRICDECNYGSYQGRCVICGGPGVSDAYYCKECTVQEKDVSYI